MTRISVLTGIFKALNILLQQEAGGPLDSVAQRHSMLSGTPLAYMLREACWDAAHRQLWTRGGRPIVLPLTTNIRQDDTHRLIRSLTSTKTRQFSPANRGQQRLNKLFELEGANERPASWGKAGLLPGITVRELCVGLSYSTFVNAAFTHASPWGTVQWAERGRVRGLEKTSEIEVPTTDRRKSKRSAGRKGSLHIRGFSGRLPRKNFTSS